MPFRRNFRGIRTVFVEIGLLSEITLLIFNTENSSLNTSMVIIVRFSVYTEQMSTNSTNIWHHLNNQQANRQLKLKPNGNKIKHDRTPKYLGMFLDRCLTYRHHLVNTEKKLKPRLNLIQKLAGVTWICSAQTLRITTLAMLLSVADYCSPVYMNSCHVDKVDIQINAALRIICGAVYFLISETFDAPLIPHSCIWSSHVGGHSITFKSNVPCFFNDVKNNVEEMFSLSTCQFISHDLLILWR